MNYLSHYKKLIRKAQRRQQNNPKWFKDKDNKRLPGHEEHHIIPECELKKRGRPRKIWNGKWNKVMFTAREHFIAHRLLHKVCLQIYGKNHRLTINMTLAIDMFTKFDNLRVKITAKTYEYIKKKVSSSRTTLMYERWKNPEYKKHMSSKKLKYYKDNPEMRKSYNLTCYLLISPTGERHILNGTLRIFCDKMKLGYDAFLRAVAKGYHMPIRKKYNSINHGWSIYYYDMNNPPIIPAPEIEPYFHTLTSPANKKFYLKRGELKIFAKEHHLSFNGFIQVLRNDPRRPKGKSKNDGWLVEYYKE